VKLVLSLLNPLCTLGTDADLLLFVAVEALVHAAEPNLLPAPHTRLQMLRQLGLGDGTEGSKDEG
jgi:hypothetical protein